MDIVGFGCQFSIASALGDGIHNLKNSVFPTDSALLGSVNSAYISVFRNRLHHFSRFTRIALSIPSTFILYDPPDL